jgi:membrane protein DedA with SNARE-associated domain
MKNAVFWVLKTEFVPHTRHVMSPLQIPAGYCYVRFDVFTAVTMKNAVFWAKKTSSYLTGDTCLRYRAQPVNSVQNLTVSRQ